MHTGSIMEALGLLTILMVNSRVCKFRDCKCVLSINNPNDYCYIHQCKLDLTPPSIDI